MANVKITELANLTDPSTTDVMPVVDVDADVTKKVSVGEVIGKISGDVEVATDGTATISELPVSKLQDGAARQLLQTAANGVDVEWTDSVDLPGTLGVTGVATLDDALNVAGLASLDGGIDVDGAFTVANTSGDVATSGTLGVTGQSTLASAAVSDLTEDRVVIAGASGEIEDSANLTFDGSELGVTGTLDVSSDATVGGDLTVTGDLTVEGTTTTLETQTVTVEDKNIELGVVDAPSDTTADGGGITLKGATDKTINWIDATDAWTFSEHIDIASAKEFRIAGTKVLDATSLGSAVVSSSLTSVGTLTSGELGAGFTTVATAQGGTGQTTYADGELLIGKTDGTLAKAALTGGTGVDVTNADGSVTVAIDSTVVTTSDTGTVTSTMILDGTIVNDDINASAAIADTKLATIGTAGKVSNSATTATDANTASAIVARDASGDFSAGTITAALTGNAATATKLDSSRTFAVTGDVTGTVSSDLTSGASIATSIASGVIVDGDVNAAAAIAGTKIDPDFGSQTIKTTGDIRCDGVYGETDTNTSIQFPGSDVITFNEGGSEAASIDSSGRLLVGTSSASVEATAVLQGSSSASTADAVFHICRGSAPSTTAAGAELGKIKYGDNVQNEAAEIKGERDGGTWTSGSSHPGRLIFSVTADGSASPTEALRISNDRSITVSDGGDVVLGTTTGTKIGTATSQKIGFYNATPVVQPTAVANITTTATSGSLPTPDGSVTIADAATPTVTELLEYCVELEAKLEAALGHLRTLGLIAT